MNLLAIIFMKELKIMFGGSGGKIFMHLGFVQYLVENDCFLRLILL